MMFNFGLNTSEEGLCPNANVKQKYFSLWYIQGEGRLKKHLKYVSSCCKVVFTASFIVIG